MFKSQNRALPYNPDGCLLKLLLTLLPCGIQMQYFLKAKFHYSKNQYANLLLIIGITGSFSQVQFSLIRSSIFHSN